MNPISPEEIKNASDIAPETKQEFIDRVIASFETFYTGDDVEAQIETMKSFGNDATAVINFAYGALLALNLDLAGFTDATGLLAGRPDQE